MAPNQADSPYRTQVFGPSQMVLLCWTRQKISIEAVHINEQLAWPLYGPLQIIMHFKITNGHAGHRLFPALNFALSHMTPESHIGLAFEMVDRPTGMSSTSL